MGILKVSKVLCQYFNIGSKYRPLMIEGNNLNVNLCNYVTICSLLGLIYSFA